MCARAYVCVRARMCVCVCVVVAKSVMRPDGGRARRTAVVAAVPGRCWKMGSVDGGGGGGGGGKENATKPIARCQTNIEH